LPADVPRLAPPKRRQAARAEAPKPKSGGARAKVLVGVGLVLVLGAGATVFVLPRLRGGPGVSSVIGPFEADLARDHFPAYQRAAEALETASGAEGAPPELRAAQAEVLLLSVLGRGADRARIARSEQALGAVTAPEPVPPVFARARALVAIARNRGREVDGLLGAEADRPGGQLVQGLRRLAEHKAELAAGLFQKASVGTGVLGAYLGARALEEQGKRAEAVAAYRKVLERNAGHGGAQIALLRLSDDPADKRLSAAEALLPRLGTSASPGEQAEAQVVLGGGLLAGGRTPEAVAALSRAVALNGQSVAAQVALGEALLLDRRYADAQGRFRALGAAALRDPRVRLGLGGALIGVGQVAEGRGLVAQAITELPNDGRGDYFLALAEEKKAPADLDAAILGHRKALTANPRFLPAALRLAALLQAKGQAVDAVGVLQKAKQIDAPAEALDLAWGEALVAAKQASKAEEVFRAALGRNGNPGPARLGLASALLAQGKLDEAQAELEKTLAEAPETPDVRRRLAELLVQRGKKPEALARLEEDVATGKASASTRAALGKLAFELNRMDRAVVVLEAVLSDEPGTPEAAFTLARVREAQGELPRALADYRRALAFENTPALHLAYGRALVRVAREEDAQREFEAAGDAPGAHLELGRLRMRRNDLDGALRAFEAEAKLSPRDGDAHLQRGFVLDKLGQAAAAADAWRAALRAEPGFVIAQYHLGRFEMDRGKPSQAIGYLRAAVARPKSLGAWEAEAYFQLGQAELAEGSRSAAAAAFKKYLDLAPPEAPARPEAQKHLQRLGQK
jgi:tetratricopeptide (TPR) repeat protein